MKDSIKLKTSLVKNTSYNFLSRLIERGASLIFTIILARFLLPELFGIYSLVMSITMIFISIMDFGLSGSFARYVAFEIKEKNKKKAATYFNYLLKRKILFSVLTGASLALLAYPLSFYIFKKPMLFSPLLAASLYALFFSLDPFIQQFFYIFKEVKILAIKEVIYQSLKLFFILFVLKITFPLDKVSLIFLVYALASFIIILFLLYIAKSKYGFLFKKEVVDFDRKKLFKFRAYLTIGALSSMLFGYIDVLMIGALIPDASYVGYYRASFGLVFSISALIGFTNVLFPVFVQTTKKQLRQIFLKSIKYSFMISIPISFGLIVLSKYIIRTFFGYAYLPSSPVLSILSIAIILTVITDILSSLFTAKEKPSFFVKFLILSSVLNIFLNFILISFLMRFSLLFAIIGAAIATILSRAFYFIGLWKNSKKIFGVRMIYSDFLKPFIAGILMVFILILFNNLFVKDMNIFYGIIDILLGAGSYLGILILIKGLRRGDLDLLKILIEKSF